MERIKEKIGLHKYSILISLIFGLVGGVLNLFSIQVFEHEGINVSLTIGIIFPLMIAIAWGWKYGLFSAVISCSTLVYIWGYDGYGLFYSVFITIAWITMHGVLSEYRNKHKDTFLSIYVVELALRLVIFLGYITIFNYLIGLNPPFWNASISSASIDFKWIKVVFFKQIVEAYVFLLIVDLALKTKPMIKLFGIKKTDINSGFIIAITVISATIIGVLDAFALTYFNGGNGNEFFENVLLDIGIEDAFIRFSILAVLIIFGSVVMRLYKNNEDKAKDILLEHQKINIILESASDIIFQLDLNKNVVFIKGNILEIFGDHIENHLNKTPMEFFNDTKMEREKYYDLALKGKKSTYTWMHNAKGRIYYFETDVSPLFDKENNIIGVVGIARDITKQQLRYEEMVHISTHDFLTGLNNRRAYTRLLAKLDSEKNYPFGLIKMDLNGLKIYNDTFGHHIGDRALIETANILKKLCNKNEFPSRIGGDEFSIVLPYADEKDVLTFMSRLKKAYGKIQINNMDLSIAMGYYIKENDNFDVDELRKRAENDMYRHKISERKSVKNKAISAIFKTLTDKYAVEKKHSEEVVRLSRLLGEALNFTEDQLKELSIAALFHDIGKISIPDSILNKPGKLTNEEYKIMKTHAENGYEILKAADEYSNLAIYASSHHEKWDGSGYPRGIKGEEIPLLSRVISIADSYETMISDRPYRKGKTKAYAISELIKYAGTQFDPKIAKIFVEKVLKEKW